MTTALSPIKQIQALNARLDKAKTLVAEVHPIVGMDDHYAVKGCTGYYLVSSECTCQDAQHRCELHKGWCKHRLAVELFKEAQATTTDTPKAGKKAKTSANGSSPAPDEDLEAKVA